MKKLFIIINILWGSALFAQKTMVSYNDAILGFDVSENGKYLAFFDHKFSILFYKNNKKIDSIGFVKYGIVDIKLSKNGDFVYLLSQLHYQISSKLTGSKITVYKRIKSKLIFSKEIQLNEVCTHFEISDKYLVVFSTELTKIIQLGNYAIHTIDKPNISNVIHSDNNYLFLKSDNMIYRHNVHNFNTEVFFNNEVYGSPLLIDSEGVIYIENEVIYKLLLSTKTISKDTVKIENAYDNYYLTKNYKKYTIVFSDHNFLLVNSATKLNPIYFKFPFELDAIIKGDTLYFINNFNISSFDLMSNH